MMKDITEALLAEGARRALLAARREVLRKETFRSGIPCPDGIKGCVVFHYQKVERPRNQLEIVTALDTLDPYEVIKEI